MQKLNIRSLCLALKLHSKCYNALNYPNIPQSPLKRFQYLSFDFLQKKKKCNVWSWHQINSYSENFSHVICAQLRMVWFDTLPIWTDDLDQGWATLFASRATIGTSWVSTSQYIYRLHIVIWLYGYFYESSDILDILKQKATLKHQMLP